MLAAQGHVGLLRGGVVGLDADDEQGRFASTTANPERP